MKKGTDTQKSVQQENADTLVNSNDINIPNNTYKVFKNINQSDKTNTPIDSQTDIPKINKAESTTEKTADETSEDMDLPEKLRAKVTVVFNDFDNKYNSRPTSTTTYYYYVFYRNNTYTNGYARVYPVLGNTNYTNYVDKYDSNGKEYTRFSLTVFTSYIPKGYSVSQTNSTKTYVDVLNDTEYKITEYEYTVVYTLENITLSVYKNWNDSGNNDNVRPGTYAYEIYVNGKLNSTYNKTSGTTSSSYTVPVFEDGQELVYDVKEINVSENYTVSYSSYISAARTLRFNITNTHIPERIYVNISILWDDEDDFDGFRSQITTSFTVTAYRGNKNLYAPGITAANNWSVLLNNTKIANGVEYNFTDYKFTGPTNYNYYTNLYYTKTNTTWFEESENGNIIHYDVTFKHIPEYMDVNITKKWVDGNNAFNIRPEEIEVEVLANGKSITNVVLNENNNWKYVLKNQRKYINATTLKYSASEVNIPEEYTSKIITSINNGNVTITNTLSKNIDVKVIWNDNNNSAGARPQHVGVNLNRNDTLLRTEWLDETNMWSHHYPDLVFSDDNGKIYNYTVDLLKKPDAYKYEIYTSEEYANLNNNINTLNNIVKNSNNAVKKASETSLDETYYIVLTYDVPLTMNITKTWDDMDNLAGLRPDNVTVKILANGKQYGDLVTISANENWTKQITLPASLNNTLVNYTVEEIVPEYYNASYDINKIDVTDKYSKINVEALDYDDENGEFTFKVYVTDLTNDLVKEGTITIEDIEGNKYIRDLGRNEYVTFTLPVTLDDFLLEDNVYFNVTYSGTNNYDSKEKIVSKSDVSFVSVDKRIMNPFVLSDGTPIYCLNYTLHDPDIPFYMRDDQGNRVEFYMSHNKIAITNETVLNLNDGINVLPYMLQLIHDHLFDYENYTRGDAGANLMHHINILHGENRYSEIIYNMPETFYDSKYYDYYGSRNVLPEVLEKVDSGNGIAPHGVFNETSEGRWIYQAYLYKPLLKLPYQYLTGIEFTFVPNQYRYNVEITNKLYLTNVNVTKIWNDTDNQDGKRPDSLNIQLYADNKEFGEKIELNESNNWTHLFENLPKYNNGKLINYTVVEDNLTDYNVTINVTENKTPIKYTNINMELYDLNGDENYVYGNFNIIVTDSDSSRVSEGEVVVRDSTGKEVASGTLNDGVLSVDLEVKLTDNTIYPSGQPRLPGLIFNYTVEYKENELYHASNKSFILEDIFVKPVSDYPELPWKFTDGVWVYCLDSGKANPDELDMPYLRVSLTNQTVINQYTQENVIPYIKSVLLNHGDDLENFTDISSGKPGQINTLIFIFSGGQGANYYDIDTYFTKWDGNTKSGERLSYYVNETIELVKSGEEIPNHGIINETEEGYWEYQFYMYYSYATCFGNSQWQRMIGLEYNYVPKDSLKDINITNTHIPEKVTVNVTKVWDDNSNQDGLRTNITVGLYADGNLINKVILNDSNKWNHVFTNYTANVTIVDDDGNEKVVEKTFDLAKYVNGTEIIYQFKELEIPDGYNVSYNVLVKDNNYYVNITNNHTPELISIPIIKTWNDTDNQDGLRPESIIVVLNGSDDSKYQIQLNSSENYEGIFEDLPKYHEGNIINYTVYELEFDNSVNYTNVTNFTYELINITNTHTPELINLTVNKVWDDNDNQDGVRPELITIKLKANGQEYKVGILNTTKGLQYSFTDLPKYSNGVLIDYAVEEEVPNGYEASYSEDTLTITNTHIPEVTEINVTKIWNDTEDNDHIRPSNINVSLYNDTGLVKTVQINSTNWNYTFKNLPKYDNGELINYTVKEDVIDGYTTEIIECCNVTKIINTHVPEKVNVTVTKVWDDLDNNDGIRPAYIEVKLYQNWNSVKNSTVTLYEGNNWTYSYTDLPKYINGKKVSYTVDEVDTPAGYSPSRLGFDYNFTLKNTHKINTTSLSIRKIWNDSYDNDGIRPESITIQVYADGIAYGEPIVLNSTVNNFITYSIRNLPKYNNSKLIEYTAEELEVPEGYRVVYSVINNRTLNQINITNIHDELITTEFNVSKVWNDTNNNDGVRPGEVYIQLYANGLKQGNLITLNDKNGWKHTFKNLQKYNSKKEIVYTVQEVNCPFDYVASYENNTIINTHVPIKINITVNKFWDDMDDEDKIRPDNVTLQLYADGVKYGEEVIMNSSWTYTFLNLPKYKNGSRINYSIVETVPEGYNVTYNDIVPFNNKLETRIYLELLNVTRDAKNNSTGSAYFNVVVRDKYSSLVKEGNIIILDSEGNIILNRTLTDGLTVINLPVIYDANGSPFGVSDVNPGINVNITINYEETENYLASKAVITNITEFYKALVVKRSTINVMGEPAAPWYFNDGVWVYCTDPSDSRIFNTTRYNPDMLASGSPMPYIKVTVTNDSVIKDEKFEPYGLKYDDDALELMKIFLFNYEEYLNQFRNYSYVQDGIHVLTGTFGDFRNTSDYFMNNTKYKNIISWIPDWEIEPDIFFSYFINNTVSLFDSGNLTLTHGIKEITQDGKIEYQFYLYNPYNAYFGVHLWQRTIGVDYYYVPDTTNFVTNITNTHIIKTNVNITKVWNDTNNQDGIRPSAIEVRILANGEEYEVIKLNSTYADDNNTWVYLVTDLPKYDDSNNTIIYTIEEVNLPDSYDNTIVNNTTGKLTINKVWNDTESNDTTENVKVLVFANDKNIENITLTEENNWTVVIKDQPMYINNTLINYTVRDENNNTLSILNLTYNITSYVLINTHLTENITLNVTKIWNDTENNDGIRPENITIGVFDGDKLVANVTLNESTGWNYLFKDLPKYRNATEIVYTVDEIRFKTTTETDENGTEKTVIISERFTPEGYDKTIDYCCKNNTTVIINTHIPVNTTVNVTKVWNDNNNTDAIRPANVTIKLLQNGDEYCVAVLNATNGWNYTFSNLPKYYNEGTEYVYTVVEVAVNGYTTAISTVDGVMVINNTHEQITKNISVIKQWDDVDTSKDRPENVTVLLYAGTENIQNITLTSKEGWKGSFENLPVYKEGEVGVEIVYTVKELPVANYTTVISNNGDNYTITNSHIPEYVNITVNKVWNDSENQDGIRPDEVTLKLKADGKEYTVKVIKANGNWNYTFTDLPRFSNGHEIVYTVEEVNIAKGYNVSYSEDTLSIVNTHIPELTQVNVTKVWDDAENNDGKRPGSVTVELYANGKKINETVLSDENNWKHTFTDLAKYAEGNEIVYTITENNVPASYTVKIVFCEGVFKVINTHIPENTSINVSKVWEDAENQDAIRPDTITVKVLANGKVVQTAVITSEDNWTYTFTGLAKYADGDEIRYTVEEIVPKGYEATYNATQITNTHIPEVTQINVTKVWDDNNNNDDLRPESVTVILLANGKEVDRVVLTGANGWKHTFTQLPVNANGKEITYTIEELSVNDYSVDIKEVKDGFEIINTHTPELTNITVNKVWDDNDDQDGVRPVYVTVYVYANGAKVQTITITGEDNWTAVVSDLPKYDNGKEMEYTVEEAGIDGYNTSVDGLTITNTHIPEVTQLNVTKVWNDSDNQDGVRPTGVTVKLYADGKEYSDVVLDSSNNWKHTFANLPKYSNGSAIVYTLSEDSVASYTSTSVFCNGTYKFINTHVPELTNITVNKVWDDNDNQDNMRPEEVTITLKSNGQVYKVGIIREVNGKWNYTFINLPKYSNGKEIVYTVEETSVPDGYNVSYDQDSLTVTNTHELLTKEINVTKVWDDDNNNDNIRPESITIELYADGVLNQTIVIKASAWNYIFTNLTVYKTGEIGKEIVYTIVEKDVANYTSVVTNIGDNYVVTNTHNNSKINLTINKVWKDAENQDAIRPETVTIRLLANGEEYTIVEVKGNEWKYTFTELPEYKDGRKVTYTIEEVNVPKDYTASVDGLTITNTHEVYTKEINVTKVWDDDNNNDDLRPESVTVILLANGKEVDRVVLTGANGWKHTFTQLPVNANGKEITYTIEELSVNDYSVDIKEVKDGFEIINTHTPELTNITVNKVWVDDDNRDGIRSSVVTVDVFADGVKVQTVTISSEDNWTRTLTGLAKYNNGKLITYTVEEADSPRGYTTSVDGLTITNTHIPEVTELNVTKVWNDNNNQDGLRPDNVTITLYANGIKNRTIQLNSNKWSYTFSDLTKYENGVEIVYTVTEDSVEGYTSTLVNCNGTFKFINTHAPETVDVNVSKVWVDNNNRDNVRPTSIGVQLYADGEKLNNPVTLYDGNKWTAVFTNLPKYDNGHEIIYTVDEVALSEYYTKDVSLVNGTFIIKNTHIGINTTVTVVKVWDDNNNNDGKRTGSITVILYADGNRYDSAVLTESDNWTYTFTGLPAYNNGKAVNYTVDEETVPEGYTKTIKYCDYVYKIINTHKAELTNVTVTKQWNDDNNRDGIRPDTVVVELLADGKTYSIIRLDASNNWESVISNLPKYDNGREIIYTVDELIIPAGYSQTINGTNIINTHEIELTNITVNKVWNDSDNNDGIRPESITVDLLENGKIIRSVTLNSKNNYTFTFENLARYDNGKLLNYTVGEKSVPEGYTQTVTRCSTTYTITNTHIPELTGITVNKFWNDDNNRDGIRPASVSVNVYANNKLVQTITITGKDGWTYTLDNLPKYDNGELIVYKVTENSIVGYTTSISGYNITNTHNITVTDIKVTKVWDDDDNRDGIRSDNITVRLYADKEFVKEIMLGQNNNWTYTFKDLPAYNNGKAVNYTVDEETVPEGYTKTIKYCDYVYKIINTHISELTNITVNKIWYDENNNDGVRPENVFVNVYANGAKIETIILNDDNKWTSTLENLPVYKDGQKIKYTIKEIEIPDYTTAYENNTVINTHDLILTNITVNKVWNDDNNRDGKRPDSVTIILKANNINVSSIVLDDNNNWTYTFTGLHKFANGIIINYTVDEETIPDEYVRNITWCDSTYTITNKHTPNVTSITINKVWEDNDNNDGIRPANITVIVYKNGEELESIILSDDNGWTFTLQNLPKYENGKDVNYTIKEGEIASYTTVINGYTITNTHESTRTNITVKKVWNDSDDNDGIRPESVRVNLLRNGDIIDTIVLNSQNMWTHTFTNLLKYDNGNIISYTVDEESEIPGYVKTVVEEADNFTVINSHNISYVNITVTKEWNDSDNNDGIRPLNITVQLYANNKPVNNPILLTTSNNWTYTYSLLPEYQNGEKVIYTISEVNIPEGYTSYITNNSYDYIITNTHNKSTINIEINKVWNDTENKYNQRPADITVNVYKNDELYTNITLSDSNNWTVSLTLDEYDDGVKNNYTISEVSVENYTTEITSADNSYTITNTFIQPRRIFLWGWKLIGIKWEYWVNGSYNDTDDDISQHVVKKSPAKSSYLKGVGIHKPYNKFYNNKKHSKWNKNRKHGSWKHRISGQKYRLYIYLYKQYFYGNMSYADFVAILKENGITLSQNANWDSNGVISIDYDDIKDVPDSIELKDNGGHVPTSSDKVEKNNVPSSSGVIDEGQVSVDVE